MSVFPVLFKANLIFKDFSRQSCIFKYFSSQSCIFKYFSSLCETWGYFQTGNDVDLDPWSRKAIKFSLYILLFKQFFLNILWCWLWAPNPYWKDFHNFGIKLFPKLGDLPLYHLSCDMRFPSMWYVRPAKPLIRLGLCLSLEYSRTPHVLGYRPNSIGSF